MAENPVIILGAGATKACGGPLTDEILPAALNGAMDTDNGTTPVTDREQLLVLTEQFLHETLNVPRRSPVSRSDCPSLPMVLSMLRRSADLGQPLGRWQGDDLVKVRRAMEYAVFAVIEAALREMTEDQRHHDRLLGPIYARGVQPTVVSLNYDVIVDNAMFRLGERCGMRPPEYGVEITTKTYADFRRNGTFGRLLKIHGSLNWLYCEKCRRLDLFVSDSLRTGKALDELYHREPYPGAYGCRGTPCRNAPACDGFVGPILITPTYFKDYENPHVERVWTEAERAMKEADRAVFIGYSLPTDDVEVAMLVKRGLGHLPPERITVVEYVHGDDAKSADQRTPLDQHATGQRFRSLFGPGLDWHTTGFAGWLKEQKKSKRFPFSAN